MNNLPIKCFDEDCLSTGQPVRRNPEQIASDSLARLRATVLEAFTSADRAACGMDEGSDETIVANALDDLLHDIIEAQDEYMNSLKQLSTYRPEAA